MNPATPELVRSLEWVLWRPQAGPRNLRDENGIPIPVLVGKPGGGNRYATRADAELACKIYKAKWARMKRLKVKLSKQKQKDQ